MQQSVKPNTSRAYSCGSLFTLSTLFGRVDAACPSMCTTKVAVLADESAGLSFVHRDLEMMENQLRTTDMSLDQILGVPSEQSTCADVLMVRALCICLCIDIDINIRFIIILLSDRRAADATG